MSEKNDTQNHRGIFKFEAFFTFDIDWSCTGSNETKFPIQLLCNLISKKQGNYTNWVFRLAGYEVINTYLRS